MYNVEAAGRDTVGWREDDGAQVSRQFHKELVLGAAEEIDPTQPARVHLGEDVSVGEGQGEGEGGEGGG